jgi:chromosome segregation ATPase
MLRSTLVRFVESDAMNENDVHKLSMQLRAAEERINQLEAEIQLFRDRAARAEGWLQTIQKEIEEKLIAPRSASGSEQRVLPLARGEALPKLSSALSGARQWMDAGAGDVVYDNE